ncbi:reverse transcriptase domain-containing protein [Paenibacillus ginsengihumi]|uniref:reverse transcriptase domain-containing protein n=1 Tax=Paenibacillus ginsengihumi TaxID=431596 RepID=UPI0009FFE064|nr:reverse transcriptase domain-containing protein [Paenibacillus ginsengihumi]
MRIAWIRVKANGGSAGIDQETIDFIVREYGEERLIEECRQTLMNKTYRASPVRRQEIPKGDGKMRPLGIPTLRDRVIQMATKIVIEPIFEADFQDVSFGFRPKRSAEDAIRRIRETAEREKVHWVVDVDITGYFDNIPHDKLNNVYRRLMIVYGDQADVRIVSSPGQGTEIMLGIPYRSHQDLAATSPSLGNFRHSS